MGSITQHNIGMLAQLLAHVQQHVGHDDDDAHAATRVEQQVQSCLQNSPVFEAALAQLTSRDVVGCGCDPEASAQSKEQGARLFKSGDYLGAAAKYTGGCCSVQGWDQFSGRGGVSSEHWCESAYPEACVVQGWERARAHPLLL